MGEVEGEAPGPERGAAPDRGGSAPPARVEWWIAALVAVAGGALVGLTTRNGVRLTSDAVAYLAMGRRFGDDPLAFFGPGTAPIVDQLNHWSPLAGLALAWTSWLDPDPLERARYLAIASGAACTALAFVLVRRRANRTAAVVAALLLLVSTDQVWSIGSLASEMVFFPLVLLALLAADVAIGGDRLRPGWLALASAAAALSCTARFIGLSTLVALLVCAWFLCRREERGRAVGIVAVVGILPAVVWSVLYGSDRAPGFHPPTDQVKETLTTVAYWVVPSELGLPSPLLALVAVVVLATLVGAVVLWVQAVRRSGLVGPDRLVVLVGLSAAAYVAMLLVSSTFLDPEIAYRPRIVYPLFQAVVVGVAVEFGRPSRVDERPVAPLRVRRAVGMAAAVLLLVFSIEAVTGIGREADDGYQLRQFTESETLASVEDLPDDAVIYSNASVALSLLQDRLARTSDWDHAAGPPTAEDLAPMIEDLRAGDGVIVFLDVEAIRPDLPPLEDLEALPELEVVATYDDGTVLRAS